MRTVETKESSANLLRIRYPATAVAASKSEVLHGQAVFARFKTPTFLLSFFVKQGEALIAIQKCHEAAIIIARLRPDVISRSKRLNTEKLQIRRFFRRCINQLCGRIQVSSRRQGREAYTFKEHRLEQSDACVAMTLHVG